jgi:predicted ATPase
MTHENISNLSIENRIEIIRNYMKQIEPDKITILTGSNSSGKSLIQQQLAFKLAKELDSSPRKLTIDVSMAKRTTSNPDLDVLTSFIADDPTEPTSLASYLKKNKDTILHNSKSMCIITLRISCKRIRIHLYILKYGRI